MFKVHFKRQNETIEVDIHKLKDIIAEAFPNTSTNWRAFFLKYITGTRRVYDNNVITITPPKIIKYKTFKLPGTDDVAKNDTIEKCKEKKVNEWTVFNEKTGIYDVFHNLAALARTFDINYAHLYQAIKFNGFYSFGHIRISHSKSLERIYMTDRVEKIVKIPKLK